MPTIVSNRQGPLGLAPTARVSLFPAPRESVLLRGRGLLGAWQQTNLEATIPHCIAELETSGTLANLRRVVGESDAEYIGFNFADSDVYKVLEAIAWDFGRTGNNPFEAFVDETVALLARVQQEDGYLNSYVQGVRPDEKLTELRWSHELYCLGHLIQAAVAWQRVAGRTDLLDIALRFTELVDRELGAGGRNDIDGHPEIETALVELYRSTGEARYLALAKRFIDNRGHRSVGEDKLGFEYFQDHEPIRSASEATGHAVRQLYLTAGAADVITEEPDAELGSALERLWSSVHEQKLYVTGGLGSRHRDEAFGDPYELPPDRAYSETCAAIANFQWNWRMLLLNGESRFADEMERGLYNAIAASTSLAGTEFFYSNPLQLREGHHSHEDAPSQRLPWYSCACCPPNLARLVASLGSYVATANEAGVQLHLYADSVIALGTADAPLTATVSTDYPWDGRVRIEFDRAPAESELRLRVPGWAPSYAVVVDGEETQLEVDNGYLVVPAGSVTQSVELRFDDAPVLERPHPHIDASRGTVAIRRGPVVYCLEQADLPDDIALQDVTISAAATLTPGAVDPELGVPTIGVGGASVRPSAGLPLYGDGVYGDGGSDAAPRPIDGLTAIPYFRWANRRQGAMRVWVPTT